MHEKCFSVKHFPSFRVARNPSLPLALLPSLYPSLCPPPSPLPLPPFTSFLSLTCSCAHTQAITKQFAEILHFTLSFDDLKVRDHVIHS